MRIQSKYLEEKLTAADSTSKWISDFVHSDNPKFAGKSKKERIRMALGASYAAKGKGTQNEALTGSSLNTLTKGRIKMPSDSGEPSYTARKKATQAQQAIVDRDYIKKVTTAAKRGSSTNTGLTAEEFVIKHKSSGQILSTHESEDSAKDEHSALSNREEYVVTRSKTPTREFSVKEQRQMHRINVTVTDPNHPATTMRNTKIQKIVALSADDKDHAVTKAHQYYKDRGYKVHDHLYMGLKEVYTEETTPPFTPDKNKTPIAKPGKAGYGPSAAKHLAKMALKNQQKKTPVDEASAEELLTVAKKVNPNATISTPESRAKKEKERQERAAKATPYYPKPKLPTYPLGGYDPKSNRSYSEEVEIEESIGSSIGGAIGQYAGSKMGLEHPARAHGELLGRAIEYHVRKLGHKIKKKIMGEEQESLPASKALQKAHDEERTKRGLPDPDYYLKLAAQKKKEIEDMKKNEEVEQIDELKKSTLASYAKKASHDARIKMATGKDFERISRTSKKPAYKASAQDWENKYKSDARRREAGVNRAIDKLAKEEVEQVDELKKSTLGSYIKKSQTDKSFYAADIGRMASAGDTASSSYDNIRRKHKNRGTGINRAVDRLTKEETELDEISQNTALNAYAKRAARAATTKDPKDREKADKAITRIGKRWEADAQRRAWNRADKLIYKEETELDEGKKKGLWDNIHAKRQRGERPARPGEKGYPKTLNIEGTELDEAGRMQGGGKDPCWKGYKMIGTKNKAGREVPNCVPVKEEKTFKSLREKLNGNE